MRSKTILAWFAVCALYSAALLSIPAVSVASCSDYRAADAEKYISRPRNLEDMLANIKKALAGDILAPKFYDDSNLLRVFNGTSVQCRPLAPPEMQAGDITPSPVLSGIREIRVRTWKTDKPVLDTDITVEFAGSSGVTVGAVRKVFGKETSTYPPEVPSLPMAANAYVPHTFPGITYVKLRPSDGDDCPAARVEARFGADVDFSELREPQGTTTPVPDQASVVSILIKVRTEQRHGGL